MQRWYVLNSVETSTHCADPIKPDWVKVAFYSSG